MKTGDAGALLFLALWPFVFYWPVTIQQKVFSGLDIYFQFYPFRLELARAFAEGRLPLWTPALQAGFPLFAEGQVAALYPLNLLLYRILPAELALSYSILVHTAWACMGMYLFVRARGSSATSAFFAGFAFGSGGFFIAHATHLALHAVASWLPWLMFLQTKFWRTLREEKRTSTLWLVLISGAIAIQFLGGSPQIALFNLTPFAVMGIVNAFIWRRDRWVNRSKPWLLSEFMLALFLAFLPIAAGMALAAVQLLPSVELISYSIRGQQLGRDFITISSLGIGAISQFLFPFLYLGEPNYANQEFWGYAGMMSVLLALLAPFLRRDARTWAILLLGLAALFLAVGRYNPIFEWLYLVPVLNLFRVPARFLLLSAFAICFLAAIALDELLDRLNISSGTRRQSMTWGFFLVMALGVIGLGYFQTAEFWLDVWKWLQWILLFGCLALLVAARWRLIARPLFGSLAIGLIVFDLTAFSVPFLPSLAQMAPPSELTIIPRSVRAMDQTQPLYRVLTNKLISATSASIRAALWPNLALTYEKQGIYAYTPLFLHRNQVFAGAMSSTMLNLMNVRYYLLPLEPTANAESPLNDSEPEWGLTLDLLSRQPRIAPIPVTRVEVTSFTDKTEDLPDGFLVGELVLDAESGKSITLPIRPGIETADWAYDGWARLGKVKHSKPMESNSFPAYLSAVGSEFQGHTYVARFNIASSNTPLIVNSVGARSFLPDAGLTIESITLIDERGHESSLARMIGRNDFALAFRSHTVAMWENRSALPRAFIVHQAELVPDNQILERIKRADFDPQRVAYLSDGNSLEAESDSKDQVQIVEYKPERVDLKATTSSSGYLVLTDTWYPGWVALVDGKTVPIYHADYIFRAVLLEPGEHEVVFEYHPTSFAWGAVISAISLMICAAVAIVGYRRRRRSV